MFASSAVSTRFHLAYPEMPRAPKDSGSRRLSASLTWPCR